MPANHTLCRFYLWLGLLCFCPWTSGADSQLTKTEDFWRCKNMVGGTWEFGRAPNGCDAEEFGDDQYVQDYLTPIIYDDRQEITRERARYIGELHLVIRDAATYYLYQRHPNASPDELETWLQLIFTTAYQESFWSHYRMAKDNRLKIMRGDSGHGHGLMQLDDRWHFVDVKAGKGWNIMENLMYGMDQFYFFWQLAPKKPCVKKASDWLDRARTAYAGYNGGEAQMCRWTQTDHTWAANDLNFLDKYQLRSWELYSLGDEVNSSIDVVCMIEGRENCIPVSGMDSSHWGGRLLKLADGSACVWVDEKLQCVSDSRDAICLQGLTTFDINHAVSLKADAVAEVPRIALDRHQLCLSYDPSLFAVGKFIQVMKPTPLRTSPSGKLLGTIAENSLYQVLDFEFRDQHQRQRYYRINDNGQIGYLYAGSKHSHAQWVSRALGARIPTKWIPVAGDTIQVTMPGGIHLRTQPEGEKIAVVPEHSVLMVTAIKTVGLYNQIYYQVAFAGSVGWMYGGQLLLDSTLERWAKPYQQQRQQQTRSGYAADHYWWKNLLECGSNACDKTRFQVVGGKLAQMCLRWDCDYSLSKVQELEQDGIWVKVKVEQTGAIGWLRDQDIRWER